MPKTPRSASAQLVVRGEVDIAVVEGLLAEAERSMDASRSRLEVDLHDVTFIDSSGLGALVQIQRNASERGISVVLTRPSDATRRLLELSGLDHVFTIAPLP